MGSEQLQPPRPGRERKFHPAAILMNLWVYPAIFIWTLGGALVSPLLILFWKIFTRWSIKRIIRHLVWMYGRGWILIIRPFIKLDVKGMEVLTPDNPAVMVINHLSFFDTFFMGVLPIFNVNLTLRSWPFKMFWYAYFMKLAEYIDLESLPYDHTLKQCREEWADKAHALFFPEGHRSRDGKMHRFYSGAFKVAIDTDRPIIPLCIVGTDTLLPPGETWLMPCTIHFHALPPVDSSQFSGESAHRDLSKHVKKLMIEKVDALRAQA